MGLENLSSPFSDISENKSNMSDVKSDQVESLYDDVFPNKLNDTNINIEVGSDNKPVSSIQSLVFQDVYTGTYSSNFTSLNHVLQADGTYKPYEPVRYGVAEDSPIGKKLTSSEEQASSNLYSGHENQQGIVVNNVKYEGLINNTENSIRFRHVDGANIGKNNVLGAKGSDLTLESIFDPTHGAGSVNILRPAGVGSTKHLDIRASGDQLGFDQPFIVKPIAKDGKNSIEGGFNRDFIPYKAVFEDLIRFGKFYTTSKGLVQLLKENVTNVTIGEGIDPYNPFSWVMAPPIPVPMTGFLNFYQQRIQGAGLGSIRKPFSAAYSVDVANAFRLADQGDSPLPAADKAKEALDMKLGEMNNKTPKILKKPLQKLFNKAVNKLAQVQWPLSQPFSRTEVTSFISKVDKADPFSDADSIEPDGMLDMNAKLGDSFVRIRDLRKGGNYIYFRGYVTGITENVTPTFNPTQYIGRSEDVYTYEKGERDLSFNLKIYPTNIAEFETMYKKINILTSLAYPAYEAEANDSSLIRMQAPFTELYMGHIGDRSQGQFGFIKSLTYTVPEGGDWDARTAVPRHFEVALTYQILNKRPPNMNSRFYGKFNSYKT